jgi:segregation and condensation protein B
VLELVPEAEDAPDPEPEVDPEDPEPEVDPEDPEPEVDPVPEVDPGAR